MKTHKIRRSIYISLLIVFVFRLLFIFFPIYSSVATLVIPQDLRLNEIDLGVDSYTGKEKCLSTKVDFDKLNNQTIFYLNSRSLYKQKSIKCIKDGADFFINEINSNNTDVDELLFEYEIFSKKIDDLINEFNGSKIFDKDKLILINDYFRNINNLRKFKKIPSPLSYEINTNTIKSNNLLRYLFSGFILFFWISYVLLGDFKKKKND